MLTMIYCLAQTISSSCEKDLCFCGNYWQRMDQFISILTTKWLFTLKLLWMRYLVERTFETGLHERNVIPRITHIRLTEIFPISFCSTLSPIPTYGIVLLTHGLKSVPKK